MFNVDELKRNGSGYIDPTAYKAIKNVDKEIKEENRDDRFYKLLDTIFSICDLAGFHVEGRIVLKDKTTGKIWR